MSRLLGSYLSGPMWMKVDGSTACQGQEQQQKVGSKIAELKRKKNPTTQIHSSLIYNLIMYKYPIQYKFCKLALLKGIQIKNTKNYYIIISTIAFLKRKTIIDNIYWRPTCIPEDLCSFSSSLDFGNS